MCLYEVGHIQLGTQHHRTLYGFSGVHLFEQSQVLLNGAVAVRTGASWLCWCTLLLGNLLRGLLVDVCQAVLDEPYGKIPQLLEVVAGIVDVLPMETEPLDVAHDVLYVFRILLRGVGIVETQIADTAELLSHTKVHADGLGVPDVNIAVGLWWETCLNASTVLTCFQVFLYKLFYEAEAFPFLAFR